jgi:ADP-heptose:LPS heptosyltransferase
MRNILLLQLNRLGDLVQTLPLLRRMRREHPRARIVLAALEGFSGILEECDCFDKLITIPPGELEALGIPEKQDAFPDAGPFAAHPEFRQSFDLLVNLTNDFGSAVIAHKVRAERKLGRIHTYEGELRLLGSWTKYMYSMVGHRKENLFNIVDIQMGIGGMTPAPESRYLPVPERRRKEAEALLAANGRRPGRKLIALQTAASELHRAWDLEGFSVLAQSLMANGFADIALLGDARERDRVGRLADAIGMPVIDLAGKTALLQLPAVLEACDLLISNDTGTIHVAAAVGIPTLGLYFSTAYYSETAPYGSGHVVLQVEIPCAPCSASSRCPVQACREFLKPDVVEEAARWMLGDRREPPRPRENLSVYRSCFLSNGSLAYLPLHPGIVSSHYLTGLLGRQLWDEALGLAADPDLEALWHGARTAEERRVLCGGLISELAGMEKPFRQGLGLASGLRAQFESEVPEKESIIAMHQELAGLGKAMGEASRNAGLCGSFLRFEMMDMDYANYPVLAEILEDKYRMLTAWAERFQAILLKLARA